MTTNLRYCYQHAEGHIVTKPVKVVAMGGGPREYFDSPFCRRWWLEDADTLEGRPQDLRGRDAEG